MSEKPTKAAPVESSPATAPSEGFFGDADSLSAREAERNAEAYRNRLQDEALAGIDEYLADAPEGTTREEAMQQIIADLEAYDAKLGAMHDAEATYGTLDGTLEQADAGEHFDGVDRMIADDARLRRMDMMAKDIAALRSGEATPEALESIQDKEDKLNELLAAYADTDEADTSVIDRIIDRTAEGTVEKDAAAATEEEKPPASTRTMKIGERVVELAGAKIPVAYGEEEVPAAKEAPVIKLKTPEKPEASATDDSEKGKPASAEAPKPAPEKSIFETLSDEELEKKIAAVADIIEGINKDTIDKKSGEVNDRERRDRYSAYIRQLENAGLSAEDAGKLFDKARKKAGATEATPAEGADGKPEGGESSDDSEAGPPKADLDAHENMRKALEDEGELDPPTSRRAQRKLRKGRRNQRLMNAKRDAKAWYAEDEKNGHYVSPGQIKIRSKDYFQKHRNKYFEEKGVKDTLFNRMRYRFGRDPK